MKLLQKILFTAGIGVLTIGVVAPVNNAIAAPECTGGIDCVNKGTVAVDTGPALGVGDIAKIIVNILLFLIGVISVIMIVVGGIRYTISNGDSNKIASAKNTIMYAVVGLVVAILAYAIVEFVIDAFTTVPADTTETTATTN